MYEILGLLILAGFLTVIGSFMISSWNTVVVDARKEEKRIFEQRVENEVNRRVEEELRGAEYRIHYKPVIIMNETDIEWGEPERRIVMHKEAI